MILAATLLLATQDIGLKIGSDFAAFEPFHVTGPYADTRQCPVCEYRNLPMVFMWTTPDNSHITQFAQTMQAEVTSAGKSALKVFVLDLNRGKSDRKSRQALKALSSSWKAPDVWLLSRPAKLQGVLQDHKLLPWDKFRSLTYLVKDRKVVAKFVDWDGSEAAVDDLAMATRHMLGL